MPAEPPKPARISSKRFAIVAGKPKADIEAGMTAHAKKFPKLPIEELARMPGVKRGKKGLIIDTDANRQMKLAFAVASAAVHPMHIQRINAERLGILRQLRGLGFDVFVPKFPQTSGLFHEKAKKEGARVFPAKTPILDSAIINGKKTVQLSASAVWARDLWTKARGRRYHQSWGKNRNPFGEGGKLVQIGEKQFIANQSLRGNLTVERLAGKGFRFFFTKDGESYNKGMTDLLGTKTYTIFDHVDLFAGAVGKVLLVDKEFHQQNLEALNAAARLNKLKILTIPENEADLHPANFLVLGENKVLVDSDAVETMKLLRQNGIEVIPTACTIKANRFAMGGVRCIVNEL